MNEALLAEMLAAGYVRRQTHPTLPLEVLNYSEKTAYEGVWNEVTRQCRGLIRDVPSGRVVARPFEKFWNVGEPLAPVLDFDAPAVVTDKKDGSLGVLIPTSGSTYAVATRGSFTSDQALHATGVWNERYAGRFTPDPALTYLYEIVYAANRIVVDYGDLDDLILLAALDTETGLPVEVEDWPGPRAEVHAYTTLAEALAAEPRPNAEGFVIYFPGTNERAKIKYAAYVSLHRILTGTNARHVWEVAAVQACAPLIRDPKHWGSFLGIDPERAAEVQALGDDWLADVPDEFYGWVHSVEEAARAHVYEATDRAIRLTEQVAALPDRRARYELVATDPLVKEIMRLVEVFPQGARHSGRVEARAGLLLRAWRDACPEPTAPFARSEAIA